MEGSGGKRTDIGLPAGLWFRQCVAGRKTAISVNFTGDNHGPHSYEKVKEIYADLHKRYPNAQLIAASFNEIAQELLDMKASLPVVTSEIGDTWIYGYGSAPIRMAKFRALSSLYSKWLRRKSWIAEVTSL